MLYYEILIFIKRIHEKGLETTKKWEKREKKKDLVRVSFEHASCKILAFASSLRPRGHPDTTESITVKTFSYT